MPASPRSLRGGFQIRMNRILLLSILFVTVTIIYVTTAYSSSIHHVSLQFSSPQVNHPMFWNRPSHPRIGKVAILYGQMAQEPVYQRAIASHQQHAHQHEYSIHILEQEIAESYWNKIYWIEKLLLEELTKPVVERADWLMWTDTDTIVLNPSFRLESLLPQHGMNEVEIIGAKDSNGFNNGVFLIRVSQKTAHYMAQVAAFRYYLPDVDLMWPDQQAMQMVIENSPEYQPMIVYMTRALFNSYPGDAKEGDFLVHFAGVTNREAAMTEWLNKIEGSDKETWNKSLDSLDNQMRMKQISHFWYTASHFRRISAALTMNLYSKFNASANMPEATYAAIMAFKKTAFYCTDDEPKLIHDLREMEDVVLREHNASLPLLVGYNPRWRDLINDNTLTEDAFQFDVFNTTAKTS